MSGAKFDPYSANPANGLGAGSGILGAVALVVSSVLGAYLAVRIAGDRRRSEALLHGAICWAFSLMIGAMLALGAARRRTRKSGSGGTFKRAREAVRAPSPRREDSINAPAHV